MSNANMKKTFKQRVNKWRSYFSCGLCGSRRGEELKRVGQEKAQALEELHEKEEEMYRINAAHKEEIQRLRQDYKEQERKYSHYHAYANYGRQDISGTEHGHVPDNYPSSHIMPDTGSLAVLMESQMACASGGENPNESQYSYTGVPVVRPAFDNQDTLHRDYTERKPPVEAIFLVSSERLAYKSKLLNIKERQYKDEGYALLENVAVQTDYIDQLAHKEEQLGYYIKGKKRDMEWNMQEDRSTTRSSSDNSLKAKRSIGATASVEGYHPLYNKHVPVRRTRSYDHTHRPFIIGSHPRTVSHLSDKAQEVTDRLYSVNRQTNPLINRKSLHQPVHARSQSVPLLNIPQRLLASDRPSSTPPESGSLNKLRSASPRLRQSTSSLVSVPEYGESGEESANNDLRGHLKKPVSRRQPTHSSTVTQGKHASHKPLSKVSSAPASTSPIDANKDMPTNTSPSASASSRTSSLKTKLSPKKLKLHRTANVDLVQERPGNSKQMLVDSNIEAVVDHHWATNSSAAVGEPLEQVKHVDQLRLTISPIQSLPPNLSPTAQESVDGKRSIKCAKDKKLAHRTKSTDSDNSVQGEKGKTKCKIQKSDLQTKKSPQKEKVSKTKETKAEENAGKNAQASQELKKGEALPKSDGHPKRKKSKANQDLEDKKMSSKRSHSKMRDIKPSDAVSSLVKKKKIKRDGIPVEIYIPDSTLPMDEEETTHVNSGGEEVMYTSDGTKIIRKKKKVPTATLR